MDDDNKFLDFDEAHYLDKLYEEDPESDEFASQYVVFQNAADEDNYAEKEETLTVSAMQQVQEEIMPMSAVPQLQEEIIPMSAAPQELQEALPSSSQSIQVTKTPADIDTEIKQAANTPPKPKFQTPQKIRGLQKK